jgi:hypothetical protein
MSIIWGNDVLSQSSALTALGVRLAAGKVTNVDDSSRRAPSKGVEVTQQRPSGSCDCVTAGRKYADLGAHIVGIAFVIVVHLTGVCWQHFLLTGPADSLYAGGIYHGAL